jgi:signal transduction histidine kinase
MTDRPEEQTKHEVTALQQRISELERILEMTRELTSALRLRPLLNKIAETASELTDSEGASILLLNPEADALHFLVVTNDPSGSLGQIRVPIESSIAGAIYRAGEPMIVSDVQADPRFYPEVDRLLGFTCRSLVGVPLQIGDRCIGVMEAPNKQGGREFSQEDVETLTTLAAQITIALENARLYEAEQQRRHEAETLYRAAQALATTLDLRHVFEDILSELQQVVPYDSASVQMLDDEQLVTIGGHGFPNLDSVIGITLDRRDDIPHKEVIRRRAPFIVQDASATYPIFRREPHAAAGTRAWLGVPLLFGDQLIGMLALDKCEPGFYTQEHARLAEAFASQAAIAIKNAQLYQEVLDHAGQLEERVQERTAELQARNEELAAYDHTVAHDLKNPLAIIIGYAELLGKDFAEMRDEELREHLGSVARQGYKMRSIIDELLLLAEMRDMEVEMIPLDMASLVEAARHRLSPLIEERSAEIVLPKAWPRAMGYGPWVEEVWVNYLSNAIKYGGQPPRVELGAIDEGDGEVCFWIRDNGLGIPAEEQARLFTRFTRLHHGHTSGHGLGLSIVQRIVEKLGGQVGVESEVGRGSTFTFSLPGTPVSHPT